ncbi:INO80 complex subunit D [Nymphon striatum]|nr:INO80 complex subunit D [Nymphon striatum]
MMYEGKHIHYSPVDHKPLCSYSNKVCKQRRLNGFAFCIRHILEDKSAPFKQCLHVAKYNNQICTNPIPSSEERLYCNSHLQVLGMAPKKAKKEKKAPTPALVTENKIKFEDRVKALISFRYDDAVNEDTSMLSSASDDPYAFNDTPMLPVSTLNGPKMMPNTFMNKVAHEVNSNCSDSNSNDLSNAMRSDPTSPSSGNRVLSPSVDSKILIKTQTGKRSSKTMNILQEKIAQNKLLGKMKKTQESSQILPNSNFGSPEPNCVRANIVTEQVNKIKSNFLNESTVNDRINTSNVNVAPLNSVKSNQSLSQPCYSVFLPRMMLDGKNPRLPPPPYSEALQYQASRQAASTCSVAESHPTLCKENKFKEKLDPVDKINKAKKRTDKKFTQFSTSHSVPVSSHTAQVNSAISHIAVIYNHRKYQKQAVFPQGFEFSDSDHSDADRGEKCSSQSQWFHVVDSSVVSGSVMENYQARRKVRPARLSLLKSEMRRQLGQLRKSQKLSDEHTNCNPHSQRNLLLQLIHAAKLSPHRSVELLNQRKSKSYYEQLTLSKPKKCRKTTGLIKKFCCYGNEHFECKSLALPFTRHCTKHIVFNGDQLLFKHCTAKYSDNSPCSAPVIDICQGLPLCPEHARKFDDYNRTASEPKNKKSKRKQKPATIAKSPKRNKKKKRVQPGRGSKTISSQIVLTDSESLPATSETASENGMQSTINLSVDGDSQSIDNDICRSTDVPPDDLSNELRTHLDSELENELVDEHLSPEDMENSLELPLDTAELANQASRLLEEHDFTEVLNKIPDDAFYDLFAESKNGEMQPSKEETEELERALAEASKDMMDVKESLEQLSPDQIAALGFGDSALLSDTEELGNQIDVPGLANIGSTHNAGLDMLNGQFSHNDLNSISQALSTMSSDNGGLDSSTQPPITMSNGLNSNSLLTASDFQNLQTQYVQQTPVNSISHFVDTPNINSSNQLSCFPVNGVSVPTITGRNNNSGQWPLQQQQQQHVYLQNGYMYNCQQSNNVLNSISHVKYPVNQINQQLLSAPVIKQTTPDPFHVVNNSTLETMNQQSTPAS